MQKPIFVYMENGEFIFNDTEFPWLRYTYLLYTKKAFIINNSVNDTHRFSFNYPKHVNYWQANSDLFIDFVFHSHSIHTLLKHIAKRQTSPRRRTSLAITHMIIVFPLLFYCLGWVCWCDVGSVRSRKQSDERILGKPKLGRAKELAQTVGRLFEPLFMGWMPYTINAYSPRRRTQRRIYI